MYIPQLEDLGDVKGKTVLVRCDFNVPMTKRDDGEFDIVDDFRIRSSVPTLKWLVDHGAKVIACSHIGRPHGKWDPDLSIAPMAKRLHELLPEVEVLENLRFSKGEEENDDAYVQDLIRGVDLYVDDAFGAAHRVHASIVGPPKYLRSAAGRLLAREAEVLASLLEAPERPFVGIMGGSKVSDKMGLIKSLIDKVDTLIVGGGMAFSFLVALGRNIGDSMVEPDQIDICRNLLESTKKIILPVDYVALNSDAPFGRGINNGTAQCFSGDIPSGWKALDIGPKSSEAFQDIIMGAKTVLWNGPLGVCEDPRFSLGTQAVATAVAKFGGFSVVGGGDSAAAIEQAGLANNISHLSTGGGASLEFLEKGDLPGLKALRDSPS
ncbi:MAG: phosphoglycerate kinase [Acidimicrobiaceae bacterium]|nr:phosphoglycerate kinase [Acidimicrobiaceae bacterium]